uniref:Myosin tail domain-containing protein n=1 Tax=Amphiprion ocellaris TaxID=80972 RepID=A0AAQ5YIV3_AMPOC
MSSLSADRKPPVDYGVQIRFIKDLHDTGGSYPDKSKGSNSTTAPSNKYGVAVRVQGISGQPYVVLKDGEKGDSYGVQLNTPPTTEFVNPYGPVVNTSRSPVSPAEDEDGEIFGSPLKRPPGDGQAGTQGEEEGGAKPAERPKAEPKAAVGTTEKNRTSEEEYNEAGLKPVKLNTAAAPKGVKQTASHFSGSMGRYNGKKPSTDSPSQPFPNPRVSTAEEPAPAIDTNSLAPINKLISKFNSAAPGSVPQTRGRPGARQRLKFDERRRSRSLDARKEVQPETSIPPAISPTLNPYAAPLSASSALLISSAPASSNLGKSPASVAKVTALEAPKASYKSPEKFVAKDTYPAVAKKPVSTNSGGADELFAGMQLFLCFVSVFLPYYSLKEILLAEERMAREGAESRLRLQEDQLAGLQEELRRVSENSPHSDSLQADVMTLQAQLAEAALLRQRQEDTLHQRERELTALKGALKEEVECHDREMEALREQYSQDMENLRRTMEQVTQSQEQIEEERQRVNASMLTLEEELESCRDQGEQWKTELEATTEESKKEFEGTLKDLQDSLLAMKKQMPDDSRSSAEELRRCHDDLKRTRADLDKQKGELDEKNEALQALRRASGEKEAELKSEIIRLKEQSQKDRAELEKTVEKAKEVKLVDGTNQELQETNARLRERLARMTRLHSRSSEVDEAVEALEDENRSLKTQLEEAKRGATRLGKERDELTRRLEERDLEREALRRGKSDLEEQKRLLDRALEKISKEMEMMMGDSRQSVSTLQTQLDDYRERSRKDLLEAQRNSKDRLAELQRAQSNLKAQQEEVSRLKKELLTCSEERDSAQLERDLLNNRLKHLESELESEKSTHTDRGREIRGLEDKMKSLEIELDEERSSVELLNDRITRSRDQVDQLRSELMQERSARHDLEMDKSALERQVKELKSRVADMEGQPRPSAGITLLESKIQEMEERLRSEEREKASIQAAQRRVERKLKELNATLDQERTQHVEQRDQLTLRVKALKRQVDESEGEVERLEGVRRKVLRDLEEQQELQEAMRAKVTALEWLISSNYLKHYELDDHDSSSVQKSIHLGPLLEWLHPSYLLNACSNVGHKCKKTQHFNKNFLS